MFEKALILSSILRMSKERGCLLSESPDVALLHNA